MKRIYIKSLKLNYPRFLHYAMFRYLLKNVTTLLSKEFDISISIINGIVHNRIWREE